MTDSLLRLSTVVINTTDPSRLAEFWKRVLNVEVAKEIPGGYFIWLKPQHEGGISVGLQQVEAPTPGPNRLHLDSQVDDLDLARADIEELGGSFVEDHEVMGMRWSVMADPDGNEFCIAASDH